MTADQFTEVLRAVAEVDKKIDVLAAGCLPCKGRIVGLETVVFGNGFPGLKIEVDRLKQRRAVVIWLAGGLVALVSAVVGGLAQGWQQQPKAAHSTVREKPAGG